MRNEGYLLAADYIKPEAYSDRYWADYYSEDLDEDEIETICLEDVPDDIADKLVRQGTTEQWYDDGYEAWGIALHFYG